MAKIKKLPKWTEVYPQGTKEGDEEQAFFIALARHPKYEHRSISAIEKESGLPAHRVEEIIAKYYKKGMVVQSPKNEDMWGYWARVEQAEAKPTIAKKDQNDRISKASPELVTNDPGWIKVENNEESVKMAIETARINITTPNIPSFITIQQTSPTINNTAGCNSVTFSGAFVPSVIGGPLDIPSTIKFSDINIPSVIKFADPPPQIKVNWGKPPTCTVTVQCPCPSYSAAIDKKSIPEKFVVTDCWPSCVNPYIPATKSEDPKMAENTLKGGTLMSDKDILTKWLKYSDTEAEDRIASARQGKIEDLKLQVLAQNPQIMGVPVK